MSLSKLWELVMDGKAWCAAVHGLQRVGHNWVTEEQPRSRGPCPAEGLGMPSCLFPTWGPCPTCQVPLQLHPPVLPKSDVLFTRLPLYRQHCPPSPPHTHTHTHTHTQTHTHTGIPSAASGDLDAADQSCPSARAPAPGSAPSEGRNRCLTYLCISRTQPRVRAGRADS